MSAASTEGTGASVAAPQGGDEPVRAGTRPILEMRGLDFGRPRFTREQVHQHIPHRGVMSLLDAVVWTSDDFRSGVALKHARNDEFWVPGHFPERALMPGVLMIEAGAQLACFLYNIRTPEPERLIVAFTRIENASFRAQVVPGDTLTLLCVERKWTRRSFVCDLQGFVGEKLACEATISGMTLPRR